jgi:hypothetical protein
VPHPFAFIQAKGWETANLKGWFHRGQKTTARVQWFEGLSSLLLVANRIDATNVAIITETTKYGEEMCIAQNS